MSVIILPDTRARRPTGSIWTKRFGWMQHVFCGNCHQPYGMVPERGMTFAFVLCKRCERFGDTSQFAFAEPDEVYWRRMNEEMQDAQERHAASGGSLSSVFDPVAWLHEQLSDPGSDVSLLKRDIEERVRRAS